MKAIVTSNGRVTIPKELRDQFGIKRGTRLIFAATPDGIRIRTIVDRSKRPPVLGCLKKELAGQTVKELLEGLRGPVNLPPRPKKRNRS